MSADTDNMATTKTLIVLLIALLLGVLVGLWLAEHRTPTPPRKSKAARPPMATKRGVIDIFDDERKAANQ